MSKKIKVVNALRPRIVEGLTVDGEQLERCLRNYYGVRKADYRNMTRDLSLALIESCGCGHGLTAPHLGVFSPAIGMDGKITLRFRPEAQLERAFVYDSFYLGEVTRRSSVGKSLDELVEEWNREHPEDPVED